MKEEIGNNKQQQNSSKSLTNILCIWGIERNFDPKQCYKYLKKNFIQNQNITHICKLKNKPFFLIKFNQNIDYNQFNKNFAKNKKIKARLVSNQIYQKNQIKQQHFEKLIDITKKGQKNMYEPTKQQLQKVNQLKIQDIVTPLHNLSYQHQIQYKLNQISKIIQTYNTHFFKDQQVIRLINQHNINIQQLKINQFIQCNINRQQYRTKCQFTIGKDINGNAVVGFNKGSYHNNTIMVQTPKYVNILSKNMKLIVALMENFIRKLQNNNDFAQFQPFDRIQQSGFWRYLVVRQSQRTKQSMIIIVCKTDNFEQQKLNKLKQNLKQYLKQCVIGLKSLCFLPYNGQSDSIPVQKPQILWGESFYQQKIFDKIFQVSPSAFLQIHIDMCEVLYNKIIEYVKQCDVILDLGCGIGTIGISIMKKLPNVKAIGIQMCQEAVDDAKKNQPNYEVHCGRVEDLIKGICQQHRGKKIIAILDPPRPGFTKQVMISLRRCRGLDNLIYVACNAAAVQDNLFQLTLPTTTKRKAPQFIVKNMFCFDLFPQTQHFQTLYVMERRQF